MGLFKMSVVVVVVVVMVGRGEGSPGSSEEDPTWHWSHWRKLQHRLQEERKAKQLQQQLLGEQTSRLAAAIKMKTRVEPQEEDRENMFEMMDETIPGMNGAMNTEELVMHLGSDVLGVLLKTAAKNITVLEPFVPVEDCVTKNRSLGVIGQVVYTMCSAKDAAVIHLHYQHEGYTTPSPETTTQAETTTTEEEDTPPPCPTPAPEEEEEEEPVDTTTPPPDTTPDTPETTPGTTPAV